VRDILAELIHAKDFGPSPVPRTGEEVVLPARSKFFGVELANLKFGEISCESHAGVN
jgi:hypothetical protein